MGERDHHYGVVIGVVRAAVDEVVRDALLDDSDDAWRQAVTALDACSRVITAARVTLAAMPAGGGNGR